jgi:transcriptional regulator with XRE-family HTH domain
MAAENRSRVRDDLARIVEDAGVSTSALSRASGVARSHVARILAGEGAGSVETYARLSAALGADLSIRIYPNTGPPIRDRHQARILEALLAVVSPRWQRFTEVLVFRPARGVIDAVLVDPRARLVLAVEVQSELRRLEQLIRWSNEKAASLSSWSRWPAVASGEAPTVSSVLVVRRTRSNVEIGKAFARQLEVAYPAHPQDALAALTSDRPWLGSALLWARLDAAGARLMTRR